MNPLTFGVTRRLLNLSLAAMLVGLPGACDEQSVSQKRAEARRTAAEADAGLVADIAQAEAEFRQRLRQRVDIKGGLLLVSQTLGPKAYLVNGFPLSTPWSISCGVTGLSVTFGAGSSEQGGVLDVELSQAILNDQQCKTLIPSLAQEIIAITAN